MGDKYYGESFIFHYTRNKELTFSVREKEEDLYPNMERKILVGGIDVEAAGICFSYAPELLDAYNLYLDLTQDNMSSAIFDEEARMDQYVFYFESNIFEEYAKSHGVDRIYYCNYIKYHKYKSEKINEVTGKTEFEYKDEANELNFGAIKYIDL